MNDVFLIGCAVAVAICFVIAYIGSFATRQTSLCEAKEGDIFSFDYLQPLNGERRRWKAKVVEPVQFRSNETLRAMDKSSNYRKNDPEFQRTNHLVTCETQDGEYRQFYCERAVNCKKPLFGSLFA